MSDSPTPRTVIRAIPTLACALALLLVPALVSAQRLAGRIIDAPSQLGIAGAVLTQVAADGRTLSRALSGGGGRFTLVLDADARTVRVVRIGYVPRTLSRADLERGDVGSADIVMQRIPVALGPVRVMGKGCPVRSDARRALALLDQARDGLLAAVVSREGKSVSTVRLRFERDLEDDDRPTSQRVWLDSTSDVRTTFTTAPSAAQLAERGFLEETPDRAAVMHAPDADVFLDDAFVNAYCFRLTTPDATRPTQVGLGFFPADGIRQRGRVNIEGTVWVDTARRELREVEFEYVGLPRQIAMRRPGGTISFLALSNGLVLIDRWRLRLAGTTIDTLAGTLGRGRPVLRDRVIVNETGGEVATLQWPEGRYEAALGALRVVAQSEEGEPRAGVVLRLEGTDYRTRTDVEGGALMERLLPGPYSLVVLDPRLAPIDLELQTGVRFNAHRDSLHVATFTVPEVPPAMQEFCAQRRVLLTRTDTIPWIIGRVRRTDGALVTPGRIRALKPMAGGEWDQVGETFHVGTDGLFWVCHENFRGASLARIEYTADGGAFRRIEVPVRSTLTVIPFVIDP